MTINKGYRIDIYSYNSITKKTGDVQTLGLYETYNEASLKCIECFKEMYCMWITYFRTEEEHKCSSITVELINNESDDICNAYQITWDSVMNGKGVVTIW